jgi:hypothetical protein
MAGEKVEEEGGRERVRRRGEGKGGMREQREQEKGGERR